MSEEGVREEPFREDSLTDESTVRSGEVFETSVKDATNKAQQADKQAAADAEKKVLQDGIDLTKTVAKNSNDFTDQETKDLGDGITDADDIVKNATSADDAANKGKTYEQTKPDKAGALKKFWNKLFSSTQKELLKNASDNVKAKLADNETKLAKFNDTIENPDNYTPADKANAKTELDASQKALSEAVENEQSLKEKFKNPKKWENFKEFLKWATKIGLGIGAIFYGLKLLSDALSGCYKYTTDSSGTLSSIKLSCPNNDNRSSCSCKATNDDKYAPWNCGDPAAAGIICKGNPGENNSVYYGYQYVSPGSVIPNLINDISKLLRGAEDALSGILAGIGKYAKYFGIAILVVIGLVLLSFILPLFFRLFSSISGGLSKKNK